VSALSALACAASALTLLGSIAGCGEGRARSYGGEMQDVTVRDQGVLCLGTEIAGDGGEAFGVDLAEGQPLAVTVRSGCLSLACVTHREARCTAKRAGDRIVVESEIRFRGPAEIAARCPKECAPVEAHCATEPLPAGRYEVTLGEKRASLQVPSHRAERCDDGPPDPRLGPRTIAVASAVVAPASTQAPSAALPATPAASVDPRDVPAAPGTGVVPEAPPRDLVCVSPGGGGKSRDLRAGQPIAITLLKKNPCVGASCSGAPSRCTAKRKGTRIVLDARFPEVTQKPRLPCTEDCPASIATCRTDALPAGTYTIVHGAQEEKVTVPTANVPPCGGP